MGKASVDDEWFVPARVGWLPVDVGERDSPPLAGRDLGGQEVLEQLRMLGPNFIPTANKLNSVITILNRMAKDEEIIQGKTEEGKVGFAWNRVPKSILQILGIGGAARLTDEFMKTAIRTRGPFTSAAMKARDKK